MSELVTAGEHNAKISDYGVSTTQKGDPMVVVKFATESGNVYWNGVIKESQEGKRNIPLEALIVMGLKSINDLESIADGPGSNVLNMEQEVRVTVVHEVYNGKTRAKAEWVNSLAGGTKFKNVMEKQDLKVKLAGMKNLRADFAAAFQEAGGGQKVSRPQTTTAQAAPAMEDIPF